MIVNENLEIARQSIDNLRGVVNEEEMPIYQDSDDLDIWTTLNGAKDDIYIYDGCGMYRYHLTQRQVIASTRPLTIATRLIKKRIRQTTRRDRCARQCRRYRRRLMTSQDMDRMQGDQPSVISMSHMGNIDRDPNRTPRCPGPNCRLPNTRRPRRRLIQRM